MRTCIMQRYFQSVLMSVMIIPICLAAIVTGCSDSRKTSDRDIEVIDYRKVIEFINHPDIPTALIDVRPSQQYRAGHLPRAINIPLPQITIGEQRLAEVKRIIVYANGWNDNISAAAVKKMIYMGYENVYDFRGGVEQWVNEGNPLHQLP